MSQLDQRPSAVAIRDAMARSNLTQGDMADILGVRRETVNRVATGKSGLSIPMVRLLGAAFKARGMGVQYWADVRVNDVLAG